MDQSILTDQEKLQIAQSVLASSARDVYSACIRAGINFDQFDPLSHNLESETWTPEVGSLIRFAAIFAQAQAEVNRLTQ